jgi:hypothetical protein
MNLPLGKFQITPSAAKRSRQRQKQVSALPVSPMMAFDPTPSTLSSTICACHTCMILRCVSVLDQSAQPIKVCLGGR